MTDVYAGPARVDEAARDALARARDHLLSLQHDAGWWKGKLETNVSMDATYPTSSQATTLKWDAESGYEAHDYVVTLFEVPTSGALIPRRVYQVLTPTVTVDGSLLDAGHKYTFSITSRNGFPNAKQGDYKTVSYPFSEATTFSGAITVQ